MAGLSALLLASPKGEAFASSCPLRCVSVFPARGRIGKADSCQDDDANLSLSIGST